MYTIKYNYNSIFQFYALQYEEALTKKALM